MKHSGSASRVAHVTRHVPPQTEQPKPSVVKGASLLVLVQLTSRLFTFIANQVILRFLTAPLLGLSAQLEVYYMSVLFFARESLRISIQRQSIRVGDKEDDRVTASRASQAVINLGYLAVCLGPFITIGLGWAYLAFADASTLQTPYLRQAVYIYGAAAMAELMSEPCFILMQTRLRFDTRAGAESLATLFRCVAVLVSAALASRRQLSAGVLPFALGQITYGLVLLLVYLVQGHGLASSTGFSLLPQPVSSSDHQFLASYFYKPTIRLARSLTVQSIVKHVLTQGDTFLISILTTPDVQGTYALATNYGGLLARLLFQPVEESCRTYFSGLLAKTSSAPTGPQTRNDMKASPEVIEAKNSFQTLARLYVLLSTIIISVGPFAAPPLLAIVAGPRWTVVGAGKVLSFYCFYIPLLAMNGLTESFVASVASETDLRNQSIWMSFFSLVFASAAYTFMRVIPLGAQGLVVANMVNMSCRIIWSFVFIMRYFQRNSAGLSFLSFMPGSAIALSLSTAWTMHKFATIDADATSRLASLAKISASALPLVCIMYVCIDMFMFTERFILTKCYGQIVFREKLFLGMFLLFTYSKAPLTRRRGLGWGAGLEKKFGAHLLTWLSYIVLEGKVMRYEA